MVYTLSTQLRELIAEMFVKRKERIAAEDEERYRKEEEVSLRLLSTTKIVTLIFLVRYRLSQRNEKEQKLRKNRSQLGQSNLRKRWLKYEKRKSKRD